MKAVVLAGGLATRLGDLSHGTPKSLISVGSKPVLEHQLVWLAREGIREVVLLVGHLHQKIRDYCGDGSQWGIKITYQVESIPLGTAGALKSAQFLLENEEAFLVLYGDVIVNMDLQTMIAFHQNQIGACATLMVHPNNHPLDSDLIEYDEHHKIIAFHGKPHSENLYFHNQVNAAVYIMHPRILNYLSLENKEDLGRDVFPSLVRKENFFAYPTTEYLKDMGSPERLRQVEDDLISGKVERSHRSIPRPAIFLDRDGVLCHHVEFMSRPEDLILFEDVGPAICEINKSEFLAIVMTNQPVVARGTIGEEGVREIHKKMEWLLGIKGAYLDGIYFCPHHPDLGFAGENTEYKIICDCRKPQPGMIWEAQKKFNIDLSQSYIVGDTWRDIGAGRKAGLRGCLGLSASPGRVGEFKSELPDELFSDLYSAVQSILSKKN